VRRRSRLALVTAILGLLVGCRAVLGIDTSREVISTDAGDSGPPDAPGDVSEPAPLVSVFCHDLRPAPGFCDDFDVDPFEGTWDNAAETPDPGVGGGGTLTPDTTRFQSAPRSALLQVPQILPGVAAVSVLVTTAPKGLATLEISAAVRIDTEFFPDAEGHASVLSVSFVGGAGRFVEIRRGKSGSVLVLYDGTAVPLREPFPVGAWKTVEMRFTFGATAEGPRVMTYIDGVGAGQAPLPADFYRAADYPRVAVGPGAAVGPMRELRMNVDNVFLRGTLQ